MNVQPASHDGDPALAHGVGAVPNLRVHRLGASWFHGRPNAKGTEDSVPQAVL